MKRAGLFPPVSLALAAICLGGAVLRFYHLGQDSFWLDEAGVAYAARAATLGEMLQVVRSHVMAMPLDYLIVWLVGRVSLTEAALRAPAALWGSLSLLLAYRLYRKFSPPVPALLGLLVLALSPLHIQYSQELRFYSALVFFYLLSTLLLWNALKQPTPKHWALFAAAHIVGVYFHPYVMFALANGLVWLALSPGGGQGRARRLGFGFSAVISLLAFLMGYLTFSASNTFAIPLMVFEQSPWGAVATGLGWLPFYPGTPGLSWAWSGLCAVLEIAGVWRAIKQPRSPLTGLFYALLLQLAAIVGADLLGHYFFAPRQLLMLLPILCLFAGLGAQALVEFLARAFRGRNAARYAAALVALLLILASLPAIQHYEQDDKGDTRAISQQIVRSWQPGDSILVYPAYDGFVYKYYLESVYNRADITKQLWAASWDDVLQSGAWSGNVFVITPATMTAQEEAELRGLGLAPRLQTSPLSRYAKTLWVKQSAGF